MQMCDHRWAAIEFHEPQPPRQALAEEKVVAVMKHRVRKEFAPRRLLLPVQAQRQALLACFARRILHRAAIAALLQLEAAERRGGGEAKRNTAARGRRQRRHPSAQHRVLALRSLEHQLPNMAAPEPRPRSKLIMPKPLT